MGDAFRAASSEAGVEIEPACAGRAAAAPLCVVVCMAAPGAANSCDSSSPGKAARRREHHLSRSAEDAEREIGRRDAIGRARRRLAGGCRKKDASPPPGRPYASGRFSGNWLALGFRSTCGSFSSGGVCRSNGPPSVSRANCTGGRSWPWRLPDRAEASEGSSSAKEARVVNGASFQPPTASCPAEAVKETRTPTLRHQGAITPTAQTVFDRRRMAQPDFDATTRSGRSARDAVNRGTDTFCLLRISLPGSVTCRGAGAFQNGAGAASSGADHMQRDLAAMRPAPVLDEKHALPDAEHERAAGWIGTGERCVCVQRRANMRGHVVGAFGVVRIKRRVFPGRRARGSFPDRSGRKDRRFLDQQRRRGCGGRTA